MAVLLLLMLGRQRKRGDYDESERPAVAFETRRERGRKRGRAVVFDAGATAKAGVYKERAASGLCTIPTQALGSSWEVVGKWLDENSKLRKNS